MGYCRFFSDLLWPRQAGTTRTTSCPGHQNYAHHHLKRPSLPMNHFKAFAILALLVLLATASSAQTPATNAAPAPAAKPPLPLGIFAVAFTNVTDTSARLVFTTSEPMTSTVVVLDQDKEISRQQEPAPLEIHAIDLAGLTKGTAYHVAITGTTADGKTVTSAVVPVMATW